MRNALMLSLFAAALLSMFVVRSFAEESASKPQIGQPAPLFSLQDQDGKTVNLAELRGKVVVLEWFNNECPFVQKLYKAGDAQKVANGYADKGVVWLGINTTSGKTNADNKQIADEWSIKHPVLNDSTGEVGHKYGATNTPQVFVIDKDGNVQYMGAWDDNRSPDASKTASARNYVSTALDQVMSGTSVSEPQTKPYGCSVKYAK